MDLKEQVRKIIGLSEDDQKPLIKWFDVFEKELKKLRGSYSKVKPTDMLQLYYDGVDPKEAAKQLKESVELDESKSFRDYTTPASPELKKWIESGKQKYILNVQSVLGPTTRFVVVENPNWFKSRDSKMHDKVLMFTISDPKRGRIKMFAFHGSHVSHQKAMQFAKNNKLVSTKDAKGNPLYAKESVEHLDEALVLASDNLNVVKKTAEKLSKQSPDLTYYVVKHKQRFLKGMEYAYYEVYQSVDMHLVRGKAKKIAGYGAKVDMRESVNELNEAQDMTFIFPNDRKAKQFALDIENSSIGLGDRVGNKVTITDIDPKWRAAIKKAMLKNRGKLVKESVELDEAHHDQRAADKALFNAMKVVDPKAKWKMVKTDPSRFGLDVEIASQKMAKYGDWTLMAWSDGRLMWVWYDHPNGEGSIPEREFKRVAKDMMKESVEEEISDDDACTIHKRCGRKNNKHLLVNPLRPYEKDEMEGSAEYTKGNDNKAEKKAQKVLQKEDAAANNVGDGEVAGIAPGEDPPVKKKRTKFAGCDVFEVSPDVYYKCVQGKKKFEHWKRYFDRESGEGAEIYEFAYKYPRKAIIVQNKITQEMVYLRHKRK